MEELKQRLQQLETELGQAIERVKIDRRVELEKLRKEMSRADYGPIISAPKML